jgi:hypothetical protein
MTLRNAYCPRTILRVYARHLSAGRSWLTLPSGGHCRSRRRRGVFKSLTGAVESDPRTGDVLMLRISAQRLLCAETLESVMGVDL